MTIAVDAVVYYQIANPIDSVVKVQNAQSSTKLLAQTTLRNVLGTRTLSQVLSDRESIAKEMKEILDLATDPWGESTTINITSYFIFYYIGIKVTRVEVKDCILPQSLQRAMAAEAEASREAKAKVS